MAVQDLWKRADGKPSERHSRGKRWRVVVPGQPSRAFATKADAVEWERRLWQDASAVSGRAVVGECVDIYLAGRRHLSPGYVSALKGAAQHVYTRWGGIQAGRVTTSDIQAWIAGLQAQGDGRRLRPMAQRFCSRVLQVLRGALEVARDKGAIAVNPADRVALGCGERRLPVFLTAPELRALAEACGDSARWCAGCAWGSVGVSTLATWM